MQTYQKIYAIGSHITFFEVEFEYKGVIEKRLERKSRSQMPYGRAHRIIPRQIPSYFIVGGGNKCSRA